MHDQNKPDLATLVHSDELAHFGKKGMKWGVRKGYVERQNQIGQRELRVASGQGTKIDKLATGVLQPKSVVGKRAIKRIDHAERIQSGQATTKDLLKLYGGANIYDLKRQPKDFGKRKA